MILDDGCMTMSLKFSVISTARENEKNIFFDKTFVGPVGQKLRWKHFVVNFKWLNFSTTLVKFHLKFE